MFDHQTTHETTEKWHDIIIITAPSAMKNGAWSAHN
jgi:RNA polymerase subunit RPABC4/transcription elongation factor Spt4